MRTTVAIEDGVLEDAKREAERRQITLGELVTDALRVALHEGRAAPEPPFQLITFGTPRGLPTDTAAIAALLAADDEPSW